jgi:tRNA threonylcarbamoyladenosine modification (KEOPS) complex Cgi121 subunit
MDPEEIFTLDINRYALFCTYTGEIGRLLHACESYSKGNDIVQVFATVDGIEKRIIPAYLNAVLRKSEGCMRSKSLMMEILLLAAGERNVNAAIKKCGAGKGRFIVFSNKSTILESFTRENGLHIIKKIRLLLDEDAANSVASVDPLDT